MGSPDYTLWADFMPDSITVEPWVSNSVSGVPTFGTAVTYAARVQMKNHRIIDSLGREIMAKGKVYVGTTTVIDVRSRVTLPAEYIPRKPPILAVNVVPDESGTHHVVLEIG